jgi:hypothetical protein
MRALVRRPRHYFKITPEFIVDVKAGMTLRNLTAKYKYTSVTMIRARKKIGYQSPEFRMSASTEALMRSKLSHADVGRALNLSAATIKTYRSLYRYWPQSRRSPLTDAEKARAVEIGNVQRAARELKASKTAIYQAYYEYERQTGQNILRKMPDVEWPTDPEWYARQTAREIAEQLGVCDTSVRKHAQTRGYTLAYQKPRMQEEP